MKTEIVEESHMSRGDRAASVGVFAEFVLFALFAGRSPTCSSPK